jgi:hypothetical protein
MVLFIRMGLGFNPDIATEAATHLWFAFGGERFIVGAVPHATWQRSRSLLLACD